MTIWLLTSEFPPAFGGGISTYCMETAKMFVSNGESVTIITQDYKVSSLTETKENGYTIVRFNPNNSFTSTVLGYEAHLSFAFAQTVKERILKNGFPDIIESQEYMGIAYYLLQFKHLLYPIYKDLKIVITLHAPSFLYVEYNKISKFKLPYYWIGEMERFCIRAADLVISPSRYLVNELKSRMKLDDIPVHVIKNPYQINREFSITEIKKYKIVFFGKLTPQKGCLEIINYFKRLWDEDFKYSLQMIGGGDHLYHPEGMDMNDFIKQKYKHEIKNGKLKLLGSIPPSEINKHINDAHLIIIPSVVDNLPYTVLEAMGKGKLVLASIQGGQSEVIQNDLNGFLFDHTIIDSLKKQLTKILLLNDESIKIVGENAYNEIKQTYSYATIFEQKKPLLQELIKKEKKNSLFPFIQPIKLKVAEDFIKPTNLEPLLSIIIPYFNMGQYVQDTIKSIVDSTYKNIEIIIVNDGSTEHKSIEILNVFTNNPLIKIINKNNEGLALTRNYGVSYANGNYIAFLDADDTIQSDYYKIAMNVLLNYNNVFFVGCWAKYFGEAKGYWPAFNPEPPYLLVHNMINSSALVYKKNAFLNSGLNDPAMIYGMEDYESVINMVKNGYHGVALPDPLWNYRIRKNSMARAFTKEKQIYLYQKIADKHKDFYSNFATDIVNLLNANGPGFNYDNPTMRYDLPSGGWINSKLKQFIIRIIKTNPFIRKIAIKIVGILKK